MGTRRAGVVDGLVRGAPVAAVVLAGAGSVAAAAHRGAREPGPASLAAGIITTAAGGTGGARATQANLSSPTDVTVTAAGDLLVPDYANGRIRMVTG